MLIILDISSRQLCPSPIDFLLESYFQKITVFNAACVGKEEVYIITITVELPFFVEGLYDLYDFSNRRYWHSVLVIMTF